MSKTDISPWDRRLIDDTLLRFMQMNPTTRAIAVLRLSVYEKTEFAGILYRVLKEGENIELKHDRQKSAGRSSDKANTDGRKRKTKKRDAVGVATPLSVSVPVE